MKKLDRNIENEITRMVTAEGGFCSTPVIVGDRYKIVNDQLFIIDDEGEKEYVPHSWNMVQKDGFVKVFTDHHIYLVPSR